MPREYPTAFKEQNTYGVVSNTERDRLPSLDAIDSVSYTDILVGKDDIPISLCLAGLSRTDDEENIARLVIGAILHASKTPLSKAKVKSTAAGSYAKSIIDWAVAIANEDDDKNDDAGSGGRPFPTTDLPQWVKDLDIPGDELLFAVETESVELAAYAGVLAFAIGKQPDANNLEAFNQKRRNAVTSSLVSTNLRIFIDDSPYLSIDILGKVHRAFNLIIKDRALVMSAIVDNDDALVSGTERMFYTIFRLSAGASLNPLLIITRFARKYPTFYRHFADLETEYHAAAHALARFYDVPGKRRLYLKVIFGNAYVPVDRNDINSLLGVAVFTLQQSEPTLANYNGGVLSVTHRELLIRLLNVRVAAEEEIPEAAVVV